MIQCRSENSVNQLEDKIDQIFVDSGLEGEVLFRKYFYFVPDIYLP